jgi:hypothetical protein
MKSEHDLDADLSQTAAPDEQATSPDASVTATDASEQDELSDEQIATISAGGGGGTTTGTKPPPLTISH